MDVKKMVQGFDPKDVGKLRKYKWLADYAVVVGGVCWLLYGIGLNLLGGFIGRLIAIVIGLAACLLCYFIYEDNFMKKGGGGAAAPSEPSKPAEGGSQDSGGNNDQPSA